MRSQVVVLTTFVVGCAVAKPSWTEVRSRHFVVQTDVGTSRAEELTRKFERSYAALSSCLSPNGTDSSGRTEVIAFDDDEEYRKFAPSGFTGYFAWRYSPIESSKKIVLSVNADLGTASADELLQHEVTHRFVAHSMPNTPLWLNEGLSEFLSTARLDGDSVVIGEPPSEHWYSPSGWMFENYPLGSVVPDPEMVRARTLGRFYYKSDYIGAWMLVHVMVLGRPNHRRVLEAYLADLRSARVSESESFARHFDAKLLAEIDAEYTAFQKRSGTPTETVVARVAPTLEVASRTLSEPEFLALRGRIRPKDPANQMRALEDANHAVWRHPTSPEGYLLRAIVLYDAGHKQRAVSEVRSALERAPGDARLERALGMLLLESDVMTPEVEALVRRVRGRATSADDFRFLASWELKNRRPGEALEFARRGASLDAVCISCYELAAIAASSLRDVAGALDWQRRAVNVAAEGATPEMLTRLSRFEAASKRDAPTQPTP